VLEVEFNALMDEFDMYDESGMVCGGGNAYLLLRKNDGKRFQVRSIW
jgi:hypothetical protein